MLLRIFEGGVRDHAVMAFTAASRIDDTSAMLHRLRRYIITPRSEVANVAMAAEVGLPACETILAFGEGRYAQVVSALHPIRTIVHRFGGADGDEEGGGDLLGVFESGGQADDCLAGHGCTFLL